MEVPQVFLVHDPVDGLEGNFRPFFQNVKDMVLVVAETPMKRLALLECENGVDLRILRAEDALEFFIAGATAVQVGTANFINPTATITIINELNAYLDDNGIGHISELVGTLDCPQD